MPRILSGPNAVSWERWVRRSAPLWGVRRASCFGLWSSIMHWRRLERLTPPICTIFKVGQKVFGFISNILYLAGFALVRGRNFPAGQPASGPLSVSGWSWSSPARTREISRHSTTAHAWGPQHFLLPVWGHAHCSAPGKMWIHQL